jgi:non-homologous end joining protein Ku
MPSIATGVSLTLGLISTTVRVESAKEGVTSLNQICEGQPNHPDHAPSTVNSKLACPACGPITDVSLIKRGRPSGDGFMVVDPAQIEALKSENTAQYKKSITLGAHPRDQFELETVRGEKLYYLVPDGTPDMYATILEAVKTTPDVALCGLWTPRSAASLFRLAAYERDGHAALVLEERVQSAKLKAVPATGGTIIPKLLAQAQQYIPNEVEPLIWDTYDDHFKVKLEALFASVPVVPGLAAATTNATPAMSPDDLMAALDKSLAGKKTAAKKTAAPRRRSA